MSLNTILPQLDDLPPAELDELIARAKALRSLGGNSHAPVASAADCGMDFVLRCAHSAAQGLGAEPGTFHALHAAALRSEEFRHVARSLIQWLRDGGLRDHGRQHGLLCLGFRLLLKDMIEHGYTVSARTLLAHAHRFPAVVNHSFPGYWQSGLLSWIVERPR